MRQDWHEHFITITRTIANRSTCLRRQVGAIIVRDKTILSTGYNGAPRGIEHCEKTGCLRDKLSIPSGERQELCRAVHSEQNAIVQAARNGVNVNHGYMYCTCFPCITCAKLIINAGIHAIYFAEDYGSPEGKKEVIGYLEQAGISTIAVDEYGELSPAVLQLEEGELSVAEIVQILKQRGVNVGKNGCRVKNLLYDWSRKKTKHGVLPIAIRRREVPAGGVVDFRVYDKSVVDRLELYFGIEGGIK